MFGPRGPSRVAVGRRGAVTSRRPSGSCTWMIHTCIVDFVRWQINFCTQSNFLEFMGPRRPPLGVCAGYLGEIHTARPPHSRLCSMSCANAEGTGTLICVGKHANYGIRHVSGQAVIGPPVSSENSELKTLYQVLLCTSYPP